MDKIKATFMLSAKAKDKLESLKTKLRRAGVRRSQASESAVVEHLVTMADRDFDRLLQAFNRAPK